MSSTENVDIELTELTSLNRDDLIKNKIEYFSANYSNYEGKHFNLSVYAQELINKLLIQFVTIENDNIEEFVCAYFPEDACNQVLLRLHENSTDPDKCFDIFAIDSFEVLINFLLFELLDVLYNSKAFSKFSDGIDITTFDVYNSLIHDEELADIFFCREKTYLSQDLIYGTILNINIGCVEDAQMLIIQNELKDEIEASWINLNYKTEGNENENVQTELFKKCILSYIMYASTKLSKINELYNKEKQHMNVEEFVFTLKSYILTSIVDAGKNDKIISFDNIYNSLTQSIKSETSNLVSNVWTVVSQTLIEKFE